MIFATSLISNVFPYQKISEIQEVLLRFFSAPWNKIFWKKNRDTLSLYSALSYLQNFSIPDILWDREGFLYELICCCDKKILTENRNIRSSLPLTFSIPEKFRKTEKFLCHFLRHPETQIFDRKTWYSLPPLRPLLFITIFDTRHFVRQRRVPLLDESVLWHKILLTENCDNSRITGKNFR